MDFEELAARSAQIRAGIPRINDQRHSEQVHIRKNECRGQKNQAAKLAARRKFNFVELTPWPAFRRPWRVPAAGPA